MKTLLIVPIISLITMFSCCKKDEPLCINCPQPEPDSTLHEYTWVIDTLGTWQSAATDVWGTSLENVYVTGFFYNPDTVTPGTNIMHWDGTKWKPELFWVGDIYAIFGFSENDIWVGGDKVVDPYTYPIWGYWNGNTWTQMTLNELCGIRGLWGTSSNNLYAVASRGKIFHYNGKVWSLVNSGTNVFLSDVWGFSNESIYACGYDDATGTGVLLFFDGKIWNKLYERNYTTPIEPYGNTIAVWGYDTSHVYISASSGDYMGNRYQWDRQEIPSDNVRILSIRGENYKNIFFSGHFGLLIHWNGKSWYRYEQFYTYDQWSGDILYGVWTKNKIVFVVGRSRTAQGIVYRGYQ